MSAIASARELALDIHGVGVRVLGDAEALGRLAKDFAFFSAAKTDVRCTLTLSSEPLPSTPYPDGFPRWNGCRIRDCGPVRRLDYLGGGRCDYDFSSETGVLRAGDPHLLHELAYLTVLSRVGDILDQRGLHRVHALGFVHRGRGGLLLLPSGGGKTRLALELLAASPAFQFLSDDIPLLAEGGAALRAFPLRLGLREEDGFAVPERFQSLLRRRRHGTKRLVDLAYCDGRIAGAAPLRWIFVGRPASPLGPALSRCGFIEAADALAAGLVLGLGTPQVFELMFPRPPYLPGILRLGTIAAARARAAFRALRAAELYRFRPGLDPKAGAAALAAFLRSCA